mmetsp:Transcript_13435/g.34147  ORF Transcript_13435/g.34147 Transcript_13435/m.34147 type:complete len:208 (-) Transcript_13435:1766-2389(-)
MLGFFGVRPDEDVARGGGLGHGHCAHGGVPRVRWVHLDVSAEAVQEPQDVHLRADILGQPHIILCVHERPSRVRLHSRDSQVYQALSADPAGGNDALHVGGLGAVCDHLHHQGSRRAGVRHRDDGAAVFERPGEQRCVWAPFDGVAVVWGRGCFWGSAVQSVRESHCFVKGMNVNFYSTGFIIDIKHLLDGFFSSSLIRADDKEGHM